MGEGGQRPDEGFTTRFLEMTLGITLTKRISPEWLQGQQTKSKQPNQFPGSAVFADAHNYNDMCDTGSLQSLDPVLPPIARAWIV